MISRKELRVESSQANVHDLLAAKSNNSRYVSDRIWRTIFTICGLIAAIMIVIIIAFVGARGVGPFLPTYEGETQNIANFMTGIQWRPDFSPAVYGVGFIIINTIVSALIAALFSFPVAVLTALFIVKVAPNWLQEPMSMVVELLAAIPSVVYGVFAMDIITDLVDTLGAWFGIQTYGGQSMLSVSLLLAIMIFPTITSLSINAISAVDPNLEFGSLALGASKTQTNFKVVLTSARSGIFAGLVLGLGRAFGEATAVSMVAGNAQSGPTWNLFMPTRTLTSTMLSGMKETTGLDYDIRFSVGIVLMILVLLVNLAINFVRNNVGGFNDE